MFPPQSEVLMAAIGGGGSLEILQLKAVRAWLLTGGRGSIPAASHRSRGWQAAMGWGSLAG